MQAGPLKILGALFSVVGIVMIIVAVVVQLNSNKFFKTAKEAQATIEYIDTYSEYDRTDDRMETRHDVYVSYETEDGDYYSNEKLGYYTSSMKEGQAITIYYDPEKPTDIRTKAGIKLLVYVFGGLGCVFAPVGIFLLTRKQN